MAQEGQTATGPNGEKAVFRNGQWYVLPAQSQQPVDPTYPLQAPKAEADINKTRTDIADTAADNRRADTQMQAQLYKDGLRVGENGQIEPIPGWKPGKADTKDAQRAANLEALVGQINRVQELYNENLEGGGIRALAEYLPTGANRQFDAAAAGLAEQGLAAFRVPGVGAQSDTELRQFVAANKPSASSFDETNEERLRQLRSRVDATRQAMGLPPADWQGLADEKPNALKVPRITEGQDNKAAGFNATTRRQDMPPAYQQAHDAFLAANPTGIDPEAYVRFRSALDSQFGMTPDPEAYRAFANEATQTLQQGGTINRTVPGPEVSMGTGEQIWNNLATNPMGAAAIGAADMGSFGGVSALAGDKVDALREEQPLSMLAGEVGGAITGTGAIGRLGKETLGRIIPEGAQGTKFLRDLLTDTTYGAAYGGISEGDPVFGAAAGGLGSLGGQVAGKTLGSLVGGISQSAPVQTLKDFGVSRMTTGQRLGGIPKTIEDAMTSLPGVGNMVTARRLEGLEDFNRAAFREAGDTQAQNIGEQGIANIQDNVVPQAYDQALGGQQFVADDAFGEALRGRVGAAESLPPNIAAETRNALRRSLEPFVGEGGEMSGKDFQRAYQNLQRRSSKFDNLPDPSGMDASEVLRGSLDDLTGMVERQAPDVVPAFQDANTTYMRAKILEDAVARGINTDGMFTPAQLGLAARTSGKKFGGTQARPERQFFDLQRAGQEVLPSKVPDSGTPLRSILAGGGLAAGAGAGGAAIGGTEGAGMGAGGTLTLGALLALLGTRRGQQSLNTVLFDRPFRAEQLGDFIKRNSDFLGSGAVPLALTAE